MRVFRISAQGFCVLFGAALFFGLGGSPASAQTPSVASSTDKWTVETKKAGHPANKPYFIEFRGRSAATYGHLYVLYGRVNSRDEVVESRIAGLHPAGDSEKCNNCSVVNWTVGHVIFVPSETGASDGDLEEKYVTARYRVWMDKAHYKELDAYIRKLQADSPLWNALFNNCVAFGRKIADHMGLSTPPLIWMEPKDFINLMREMNGQKEEQLPLLDASSPRRKSASGGPPIPRGKPTARPVVDQSTSGKPAPAKPKKPVAQNPATQALASSGAAQ
jgi:hypothetical protein